MPELRPFLEKIEEDSAAPWADADLQAIASTLTKAPTKWRISDAQPKIDILRRKPFPNSDFARSLEERIDVFEKITTCPDDLVLRQVTADDLLPVLKKMNAIPKWTLKTIKFAIPSLTGIAAIHTRECSEEGVAEVTKFYCRWLDFVDEHPALMGEVG